MPRFGPIKRQDLIRYLRRAGFAGPYSGGRHQFMVSGDVTIWIPKESCVLYAAYCSLPQGAWPF